MESDCEPREVKGRGHDGDQPILSSLVLAEPVINGENELLSGHPATLI